MKPKLVLALGASALVSLLLSDCGGDLSNSGVSNSGPSSITPGAPPSVLDTQVVLGLAEKSSETADPFVVDGGAVSVYPTDDETSDPIGIDRT